MFLVERVSTMVLRQLQEFPSQMFPTNRPSFSIRTSVLELQATNAYSKFLFSHVQVFWRCLFLLSVNSNPVISTTACGAQLECFALATVARKQRVAAENIH